MSKDLTPERVMKVEKTWPAKTVLHASYKMNVIDEEFGISQTRYYQALNRYLDDPEFIALDPVFARILRERRDAGLKSRDVA